MRTHGDVDYRRVPVKTTGSYWETQGSTGPFSRTFLVRHTGVPSLHHLLRRSGLLADARDVDAVLASPEWDAFIRRETPFAGWQDMKDAALEDTTARQMLNAF